MSDKTKWHDQPVESVVNNLQTSSLQGLSTEEAKARLEKYGPNELIERPPTPLWQMFLEQFNNFLVIILLVSSIVSFFLGEYVEAGAIMAIVVLNAVLGVVQESKAEEALAALKKMAAPHAQIIRDGSFATIPARELVPGDLVILEAGNYVPADLRLVESVNLRIDEAALTGESVPVEKRADVVLDREIPLGDRRNTAYMGTLVTYGRGRGAVVSTGMRTEFGLIAEMIQTYEEEPTPLQIKLDQLGKWLGWACLAICGVVFVVGLLYGVGFLHMFLTAISLAIAAVPEGLPAVVTICLALGMQEMIRRHALLRRLPAVETLGSATAICSDKTGTLTQNKMMAVRIYAAGQFLSVSGEGYEPDGEFRRNGQPVDPQQAPALRRLLRAGLLCNDAYLETSGTAADAPRTWRLVGDPTEGALVVAAAKAGLWKHEVETRYPRVAEVPFDSERKRMTTIHRVNDQETASYVAYVKGAPDIVLELCDYIDENGQVSPLTAEKRAEILRANESMADEALRVLGVAYRPLPQVAEAPNTNERMGELTRNVERELTFMGLIGMIDPARPEVKPAIALARRAGIKTAMVTGDYKNTAMAIARDLNLLTPGGKVLTGAELDGLSDEQFARVVDDVQIYARVSPQHKVRIVEAFKARGHVVAMTGDGVNDAPALKRANIGVAMGITGTDVSKETADMVLTDDNYASIVSAVEEGRIIYSNIRKFVYYLLSCNLGEIMVIFLAMLGNWGIPLTPIQLLWLNLLTDGAPALALGLEKGDPGIMERPPRPPKEPIINHEMVWGIFIQTLAITGATLAAFLIGKRWFGGQIEGAQTMAFVTLSTSELFRAYTSRSERYSVFQIGVFSNKYMQMAVAASIVLLLAVIYVPFLDPIFNTTFMGLKEWAVMLPLIFIPSAAAEITKWSLRQSAKRQREMAGSATEGYGL